MSERLYRSEHDRMIAGVCGGLADHLDIDPTLVRIGFVALAFIHGIGILAYLVMALIVPRESRVQSPPRDVVRANAREYSDEARRAVAGLRDAANRGESEATKTEGGGDDAEAVPAEVEDGAPTTESGSVPPPPPAERPVEPRGERRGGILGTVLIVVGLLVLAHNLGFIWWIAWEVWWPVILVLIGVALTARALRR